MILKSITLENFRSHKETPLSFNTGITTIIGPNGSGKSSIFEAISFALYRSSNYNIDDLIRRGTKRFKVELVFELGGKTYKVVRGRGKGYKEDLLYIGGKEKPDGESCKEVDKKIEEILGIKKDVFQNAIYIKQGEIDSLIKVKPSERKKIIGELLGIDRFEKVWKEMGEAISEFEKKLENIRGQLSSKEEIEREIEEIKERIKNEELELERLEREYRRIEDIYQEKKKILEKYREKERKYRELEDKIRDIEGSIAVLERERDNLKRDLEDIRTRIEILKSTEENYRRYCEIEKDLERISLEMKRYQRYFNRYRDLVVEEEMLKRDIEEISRRIEEEGVEGFEMEDVIKEIVNIEERLKHLEDIREKLSELENLNRELEEIERYRKELERCKKGYLEYLEIEDKLEDLKYRVDNLKLLREKREEIKGRIEKLKREISKLERELTPLKEIEEKIKMEEELRAKVIKYREELQRLESKITEIKTRMKELEEIIEKLSKAGDKCPLCQSYIDDSKKESLLRKYREDLKRMERELEKLYRDRERYRKEIDNLEKLLGEIGDLKNKYGMLKERENYLQNKYRELEGYVKELQYLDKEIEGYKGVEEEYNKLIERRENLKIIHRRYESCKDFLERKNREELVKKKEELLKAIGDYSKEEIDKEKRTLRAELDRWMNIKRSLEDRRRKEERLNKVLSEMKNIKKYVDLYEELEGKKVSLDKEIKRYRGDYERYKSAYAVLDNYSRKYKLDVSNLLNTLEERILDIGEELATLSKKREECIWDIESLGYSEEEHQKIEKGVEKVYSELVSVEKNIGEYKVRLDMHHRALTDHLKKLEELEEKEREEKKLKRYIEHLKDIRNRVFSKDGFQQYLRKRYIPLIQRYTNEIFSEFELPYHHIQIKEDYNILVDGLPVQNLSGGEQIAVSLALRLGIAKALCNNLQFIVLDEPTAYLDEERRKKLLKIFRNIKSISQIFIISHHQELEQIADNVFYVSKEGGISKVTRG